MPILSSAVFFRLWCSEILHQIKIKELHVCSDHYCNWSAQQLLYNNSYKDVTDLFKISWISSIFENKRPLIPNMLQKCLHWLKKSLSVCSYWHNLFFHFSSTSSAKCSSLDSLNIQHSEQNGVMDWRRKTCIVQQHPEHCTNILDQVCCFFSEAVFAKWGGDSELRRLFAT